MEFDIAAIIMGHREGDSCRASLHSFDNAVQAARAAGLRVQVIQHLDDPDPATQSLFDLHKTTDTVQIVSIQRDPGLARNAAIQAVKAEYVALLDADELWSFDWLTIACDYLRASPAHVIAHPQFQFCFGREQRIVRLPDQEGFEFDLDLTRLVDLWNGIGVCRTSAFLSIPFQARDHGHGVTHEYWTWNVDAISAGHVHKVIPQTAIFRHVLETQSAIAGPIHLPPVTALSRYDSTLYGPRARVAPPVVAPDGFLDVVSDTDAIQLHRLLLGRDPDHRSPTNSAGLASMATQLIKSAEFVDRLHRMLESTTASEASSTLSKAWIESRLGILIDDVRPGAVARSALLSALSTFPIQSIFDHTFGTRADTLRESLQQSLRSQDGGWKGYIDHCSSELIKGWIVPPGNTGPTTIAIRVGGMLAGICEASLLRRDVAYAEGTNGLCGFELVPLIDWSRILEPRVTVTLHDVDTGDVIPVWAELPNQRCATQAHSANGVPGVGSPSDAASIPLVRIENYDTLLSRHRTPSAPLPELSMRKPPMVSIVVHVDPGTLDDLDATLQGVIRQSHSALQIVIVRHDKQDVEPTTRLERPGHDKPITMTTVQAGADEGETFSRVLAASRGDYLCFVKSGCVLDGETIAWFSHTIQRLGARIVYADEVTQRYAARGNRRQANLKPSFDYDLLLQSDYISDVFCASKADLTATMKTSKEGGPGRQYDLLLQLLERVPEDCIFHVPLVLHARQVQERADSSSTPMDLLTGEKRRAAERHLLRTGEAVMLREAPTHARLDWAGSWLPQWSPPTPRQRMAIIIPTRDRVELLKTSVASLQSMMADPASCDIIVMDNGSEDPATLAYLDSLRDGATTQVIRSDGPFNWSAWTNMAAAHTDADLLLFANNDIEVLTEGFDDILRGLLRRPDVGAVGTLLLYPHGAIQHAGTAIGIGGVADHIGAGRMPADQGVSRVARFQRSVGAVTGAFIAMRRSTFFEVGGLDDVHLKIAFSDVDLCLKVAAAGLRILYTPRVFCLHHESASRGLDTIEPEKNARANAEIGAMKARWGRRLAMDCHYNLGYDRYYEPFTTVRMPNTALVLEDLEHQLVRNRMPEARRA